VWINNRYIVLYIRWLPCRWDQPLVISPYIAWIHCTCFVQDCASVHAFLVSQRWNQSFKTSSRVTIRAGRMYICIYLVYLMFCKVTCLKLDLRCILVTLTYTLHYSAYPRHWPIPAQLCLIASILCMCETPYIIFTPARDFLLETPRRIIIPNPNVNSHSLWSW
jgi:hypothetical protein